MSSLHVEHGCVDDCRAAADLALDHDATIVRFRASRLASATTATLVGRRARPIPHRSFRRTGSARAQAFDSIKLRRCTNAGQRWYRSVLDYLNGLMQSEQYASGCGPASLTSIRTAPSNLEKNRSKAAFQTSRKPFTLVRPCAWAPPSGEGSSRTSISPEPTTPTCALLATRG